MEELNSVPEDVKEEVLCRLEIEKNNWPSGQYDFCVVYSEQDEDEAISFRDAICLEHNLDGVLEIDECVSNIGSGFSKLEEMVNRSTKVFLLITRNFKDDYECIIMKNELLARHIQDRAIHLVPVYINPDSIKYVPFGLMGMIGIKWHQPNRDRNRIVSSFSDVMRMQKHRRKSIEERRIEERTQTRVLQILGEVLAEKAKTRLAQDNAVEKVHGVSNPASYREPPEISSDSSSGESENESTESSFTSTFQTNIGSAADVHVGPVFNIQVAEGATLHLNPSIASQVTTATTVSAEKASGSR